MAQSDASMLPSRAPVEHGDRRRAAKGQESAIKLHPGLKEARFVTRTNRFVALVAYDGGEVAAHVPNTGRMRELLRPGARAFITPAPTGSARKTEYDLTLIEKGRELVAVDSRLPNLLLHEAIEASSLSQLAGYSEIQREVVFEDSRIYLLLSGGRGQLYVEAKSVNLVVAASPCSQTRRQSEAGSTWVRWRGPWRRVTAPRWCS